MLSSLSKHMGKPIITTLIKQNTISQAMMSSGSTFETLSINVPKPFVYHVEINRPKKMNAMNSIMRSDINKCFEELHVNADCRVIILSGAGKVFTSGVDLTDFMNLAPQLAEQECVARKAKILDPLIKTYQNIITALEICHKPVLVAVHSACIGAGVDLITAADMRYCTKDAYFQVKEVDIGLAADVGTLQRLPKVIGSDSLARELCYTARKFMAEEALGCGLVSKVYDDKESMLKGVLEVAEVIASKSPVAIQGTKASLVFSRDHSVQEGLDNIATWNRFMLQCEDLPTATMAQFSKDTNVVFSKL